MTYWLDLFTGTTWKEFRDAGSRVSGFSQRRKSFVAGIKPGDILLCYLTGVMRWVGVLEVIGPSDDRNPIWKDAEFPLRFAVKPLILLNPEHGIPMQDLMGKVDFYESSKLAGKFKGFLRGSPARFKRDSDGELISRLLKQAEANPVARPVDPKKLARKPFFKVVRKSGKKKVEATVTIPEPERAEDIAVGQGNTVPEETPRSTRHTEIQHQLLSLGAEMGLDVWVARNDRSRIWAGQTLGGLSRVLDELPTQFDEVTNGTIELIDVLWLKGKSIVAAFEVECTTAVYSGLLRMSDLLSLQPNLDIKLYLVAPDDRRDKVAQEIRRPTFALREKPLPEICGFIPFGKFCEAIEGIRKLKLASSLQPSFLASVTEYFKDES